jgi:hypothetical protein
VPGFGLPGRFLVGCRVGSSRRVRNPRRDQYPAGNGDSDQSEYDRGRPEPRALAGGAGTRGPAQPRQRSGRSRYLRFLYATRDVRSAHGRSMRQGGEFRQSGRRRPQRIARPAAIVQAGPRASSPPRLALEPNDACVSVWQHDAALKALPVVGERCVEGYARAVTGRARRLVARAHAACAQNRLAAVDRYRLAFRRRDATRMLLVVPAIARIQRATVSCRGFECVQNGP